MSYNIKCGAETAESLPSTSSGQAPWASISYSSIPEPSQPFEGNNSSDVCFDGEELSSVKSNGESAYSSRIKCRVCRFPMTQEGYFLKRSFQYYVCSTECQYLAEAPEGHATANSSSTCNFCQRVVLPNLDKACDKADYAEEICECRSQPSVEQISSPSAVQEPLSSIQIDSNGPSNEVDDVDLMDNEIMSELHENDFKKVNRVSLNDLNEVVIAEVLVLQNVLNKNKEEDNEKLQISIKKSCSSTKRQKNSTPSAAAKKICKGRIIHLNLK